MSALDFEFLTPPRIVFGWGQRHHVGPLAATLGRRAFVVLGSRTLLHNGVWKELAAQLNASSVDSLLTAMISHEPEVADVDHLAWQLRGHDAGPGDFLLALGGGSAIDLAKAAAALATNHQSATVKDFLEGVGTGLTIDAAPLPVLAMPTTAGTGTEATKNAVITSYDPPFKKSLRSPLMVPRLVVVDPELTVSLPAETTISTGMDAITQLIESYLTRSAKPMAQALAIEGLRHALPNIRAAVEDGTHQSAREALSYAALLSGLALANSGLGFAHGIAAGLGCVAKIPHGLACAMMLPVALEVNRTVALAPLAELARRTLDISADDDAAAQQFCGHIDNLCQDLHVPRRLSAVGIQAEQLDALLPLCRGNSMNGNPRQLSDEELKLILERIL